MTNGFEKRYEEFIKECQKVADAYGITLEQYFDVTIMANVNDFKKNVKFDQIFCFLEATAFVTNYYKKGINHETSM